MMLEGGLAYSALDLAVGFVSIALGTYVFLRNPYLRLSKLFLLVTALYFLVSIADFFMANATGPSSAIVWARLEAMTIVGAFAMQFYLITLLPFDKNPRYLSNHRVPYFAITVALAVLSALLVDSVEASPFGWRMPLGPSIIVTVLIMAWFVSASVSTLIVIYERSDPSIRGLIILLSVGVSFPLLFILVELGISLTGTHLPTIFPLGFLLSSIVFMYEVINYDLFQFKAPSVVHKEVRLPPSGGAEGKGKCWLIEGKRPDPAYLSLLTTLGAGGRGLVITRLHPDRVREDYGLVKVPIIWLATQAGPDRVDPASLSILQHTIVDFLQKGPSSVILLDGLEYLISENQSDKVIRMIYAVRDAVTVSGSKLLVPLDPDVLAIKDRALLEREFDIIKTEEGAGSEI